MEILELLKRQFSYDAWANSEVLQAIKSADSSSEMVRCLHLMAHIVAAERLWLERLRRLPQSLPVWPELALKQMELHATELAALWSDYLDRIFAAALSTPISYKNSRGESWTNTIQDILTHVLFHSAYHRGQIAIVMRANGFTPASTDFIHSVRQGLIE